MAKLQRSNLWWLVLGSAFITSFTFAMPFLTGVRSSTQWPLGVSVLFTIGWLAVAREGIRVPALIANGFGAALGLLISKVYLVAISSRPQGILLWFTSVIVIVPLGALFIWSIRKEHQALEYVRNFEEELNSIEALPQEERLKALDAKTNELFAEIEAFDRRTTRLQPLVICLVGCGGVLLALLLVEEFRRGPRLVSTLVDLSGLILCVGYLGWLIYSSVADRRSKDKPTSSESEP